MAVQANLTESDYEKLEKLVAKIQKELAPDAEVLHNVRIKGRYSKRDRQIDVLLRQKIGQYTIMIVIDCKDYSDPVDVKGVEEFWGLLDDVGGQKGVLVCPKGFSASAKRRAQDLQIDLYSPVDTDPHKWQARVKIPAICDYRSARVSFGISSSAPAPFRMEANFFEKEVYTIDGNCLGSCLSAAIGRWNRGAFPIEPGTHKRVPIFGDQKTLVDNGYGELIQANLFVGLSVEKQLYYGQYPISRISGFKNEITNDLVTNAFEIGLLDHEEVEKSWKRIDNVSDAPVPPVFALIGLIAWAD